MKKFVTLGDRTFEKGLLKLRHDNQPHLSRSLSDNGPLYYNNNREQRAKKRFFDGLDIMSQPALIKEIKVQVNQKKDLMRRIEELERLILLENNIRGKSNAASDQDVEHEKRIISQQFDQAFNITSPKKMDKTYATRNLKTRSKKMDWSEQSAHFPEHAFSLSE